LVYEEYYGFSENPFGVSPDPKFLYMAPGHFEAFSSMLSGVRRGKGIDVITGDAGMGKTTLIYAVLNDLDKKIKTALIFFPSLNFPQLLRAILTELGLPAQEPDHLYGLLQEFYRYLSDRLAQDDKVAVIIDEAQNLRVEVLQDLLRLVSRPAPSSGTLNLLLVGQLQLEAKVHREENWLGDSALLHRRIRTLDLAESRTYVDHRLKVVGSRSEAIFTPDAVERICRFAGGIPRVINVVCDKALLHGYAVSAKRIDNKIVKEALEDLRYLEPGSPRQQESSPPRRRPTEAPSPQPVPDPRKRSRHRSAAALAGFALIVLVSVLAVVFVRHWVPVKGSAPRAHVQEKEAGTKTPGEERTEARSLPTVTATRNSTLLGLAKRYYGHTSPTILDMILEANPDITDMNRIYVQQRIAMPPLSENSFVLPGRDNRYMVYLGTFIDKPSAGVFKDEPALKGKTVEVVPRKVSPRETWYRVLAGPFATREEGLKCLRALRSKGSQFEFGRPGG
jgi:general secretion pathway protein A